MFGIALLLAGAATGHALARAMRTPAIPTLILAGVILAATGLPPVTLLRDAIILGVTFLLFVTGLELNPRRARAQRRAAVRVGVGQFFALAGAGLLLSLALGFSLLHATYLALALTASSTLVIIRLLRRRSQMFEPFGRLVFGVLLIQNLLVIVFIPVVTRAPAGVDAVGRGLLATAALGALAWGTRRWAAPRLLGLDGDDEPLLIGLLSVLFVFIVAADALGLPLVAGAFLAGLSLSDFPLNGVARSQLGPIGDFFSAVFFTSLGALAGIPSATEFVQALALALLLVLATPPLVAFIAERAGLPARPAIEAGLLLSQASELSLVVVLHGVLEEQIGPDVFTVVALVTVLTMLATPFLTVADVVWRLLRLHPVRAAPGAPSPRRGHVLVLGAGTTGMPLVETLIGSGRDVVVVDDDPTVIDHLRRAAVPCLRGEAADVDVLDRSHARDARMIISTIRRPEDNARLLEHARAVPTLIRVFDDADAAWVRRLGAVPILYSAAAADDLLTWFDRTVGPHPPGAPRPDEVR